MTITHRIFKVKMEIKVIAPDRESAMELIRAALEKDNLEADEITARKVRI